MLPTFAIFILLDKNGKSLQSHAILQILQFLQFYINFKNENPS